MRKPQIKSSKEEFEWCWDNQLDFSTLKEVLILMEEIWHWFSNTNGVPVATLNSWVPYDERGFTILKTVIGGSFYWKYMKAEYKNETELKRYVHSDLFEGKSERCLIYNKVPDYVKEEHIKKLIHWKVNKNVEKVMISYDKPIVILENEEDH